MENKAKIQIPGLGSFIGELSPDLETLSKRIQDTLDGLSVVGIPCVDVLKLNESGVFECKISFKPVKPLDNIKVETEYLPRIPHIEQQEMFK